MNYSHLAGRLGADPETRFTSNGQKVTTLRVACRARKNETIWWKVTIWGEQFDKMLPYFKKGSAIMVTGEIMKPEMFTGKDGNPQVSMQVVAHNISFSPFGKSQSSEEKNNNNSQFGSASMSLSEDNASENPFAEMEAGASQAGSGSSISDDEIPF